MATGARACSAQFGALVRLFLLAEAEEELAAAARWYEKNRRGLGIESVAALDRAFDRIRYAPHSFPTWREHGPFHRCVVQQFPYVVIFESLEDVVRIVAVAHGRRRPGYWRQREEK